MVEPPEWVSGGEGRISHGWSSSQNALFDRAGWAGTLLRSTDLD